MKSRTSIQITRSVIFALVLREMRTRFGQRRMGAFWMVAEPVIHLLMFTVLMGLLRGRGDMAGVPYPIFLLVGVGPFILYRSVAFLVMEGVSANRALFAYKQITPMDTFVARTLMQFCVSSIAYVCILGAFAWYGFDVSVSHPLEWLAILVIGLLFSFGLGTVLAIVVEAVPDSKTFIRMLFIPMYFISGVVFPPSHMPQGLMPYLMWNPFLHMTELIRASVFPYYEAIYGVSIEYVCASTIVLLCTGLGLYRVRRLKLLTIKG